MGLDWPRFDRCYWGGESVWGSVQAGPGFHRHCSKFSRLARPSICCSKYNSKLIWDPIQDVMGPTFILATTRIGSRDPHGTRSNIFRPWTIGGKYVPGRQCSTGLWYITVSQDICPPMAYWGIYITQHARIHTSRTSSSTSSSRWRSRIARWLSVLHQYTAFPLRPFLGTRVRIPRKSHFN